jgi:hypothetical protein
MGKPNDLVQGTLDLLILKTIALEPKHGWPSPNGFNKYRVMCFKFGKDLLTPLYIAWNKRLGSGPNGRKQRQAGRPSSMR